KENEINKEWEALNQEKKRIVSRYFPKLDQAQIIYLLNSLIEDEKISTMDLNFSRAEFEDIGGFQVKNMGISIPYSGSYEGVINVINRLKESPRKILLSNISMDTDA